MMVFRAQVPVRGTQFRFPDRRLRPVQRRATADIIIKEAGSGAEVDVNSVILFPKASVPVVAVVLPTAVTRATLSSGPLKFTASAKPLPVKPVTTSSTRRLPFAGL